jgi:ubiquinone/menaquinone biosynthesis C-methylase UbiE
MDQVAAHFDQIGEQYDSYKKKNWYYYNQVKRLYREYIAAGLSVLEIGCGTGDVLAALEPKFGIGIDISKELIACANKKYSLHKNLTYISGDCTNYIDQFHNDVFDFIFMSDVIEHLDDVGLMVKTISQICSQNTKVVISMANPLWEPLLLVLEKLGLKMPEGPHHRISGKKLEKILQHYNLCIEERGERVLIPAPLPGADWVNKYFYKIPLFKKIGLIQYWICKPC